MGVHSVDGFRTESYFEKCVDSVEQFTPIAHRWLLVDDASDTIGADCVARKASQFRDAILIRTQSQNWFSKAHNKGLRLVRTPRAVILNSDTECGEGWLEELLAVWEEVEQETQTPVGMVVSTLNASVPQRWICTQPPQYCTMHAALLDMAKCFEIAERRGTPGEIFDTTSPATIHIRSDVELSHRLNQAGYQTVQSFRSVVQHHGGRSWGHLLGTIPCDLESVQGL